MLRIGCHLSSSGGYTAMGKTAEKIGANTFQFFTRNPRGGKAKPLDVEDINEYIKFADDHGIAHILAHAPYTLNACSADPGVRKFARETMADDLRRLEYLPEPMYNFHPGSHVKQGAEKGIELICDALNSVLTEDTGVTVLLETMAGKGSEVGRTFGELRAIIDGTQLSDKLGVCLDTCHVFDGGYDIVGDLDGVLDEFDRVIGIDRLKAVHLNDSKNVLGSHKDRHEKIGEGNIGLEAFRNIVNNKILRKLPMFLETPNDLEGYAAEIKLLRGLECEE
ncbi:MAG: deoxyribonuclease IV [Anaerovoracaceae bacterium]|jgi:deoxyribonuclease-4